MKLMLQQVPKVKGSTKRPLLAPEAAASLAILETDTDGLIYTEMWRDPIDSLLAKRLVKGSPMVGYSPHNYGLAIEIDVAAILDKKKIKYDDLLWLMKKRGWYCYRRDKIGDQPGAGSFNFLGGNPDTYLARCTYDPTSWATTGELRIWERHYRDFELDTKEVQTQLSKLGLFKEPYTGQIDIYTREAIMAFQRTWELNQTGTPDMTLCRVLALVAADLKIS